MALMDGFKPSPKGAVLLPSSKKQGETLVGMLEFRTSCWESKEKGRRVFISPAGAGSQRGSDMGSVTRGGGASHCHTHLGATVTRTETELPGFPPPPPRLTDIRTEPWECAGEQMANPWIPEGRSASCPAAHPPSHSFPSRIYGSALSSSPPATNRDHWHHPLGASWEQAALGELVGLGE